jgi:hypothetical protein
VRVSFVAGLAGDLPLADGSVDVLCCERVLQHLSDPQAAIDDFARWPPERRVRRPRLRRRAIDRRTWTVLVAMTRTPSRAERHSVLVPGRVILKRGSSGLAVRGLQAPLKQIGWYSSAVTATPADSPPPVCAAFRPSGGFR